MAKTGEETQPMYEKQPRKRLSIKQWDLADRPREKMMMFGRTSLSNAELLAIIIGSGNANLSAVDLAKQILGSATICTNSPSCLTKTTATALRE